MYITEKMRAKEQAMTEEVQGGDKTIATNSRGSKDCSFASREAHGGAQ
jgi:hypothetical protein